MRPSTCSMPARSCRATSARSTTACTRPAGARSRIDSTSRSASGITSGICGLCDALGLARTEHTALNFARRRLRQSVDELDRARILVGGNRVLDELLELAREPGAWSVRRVGHDERLDDLTALGIR